MPLLTQRLIWLALIVDCVAAPFIVGASVVVVSWPLVAISGWQLARVGR